MGLEQFSLEGKVALVTGAGRGIGKALGLADAGASVAVTEVPERLEDGESTAALVRRKGRDALALPLDVRSMADVRRRVAEAVARLGRLDVLVNNAGWRVPNAALVVTEEEWDQTLDINLKGLFFCAQAAARHMVERGGGGRIVNIASQLGLTALPNRAPYCASKGGVVNLTRALALEWAPYSITVNAIGPGPTRTGLILERYGENPIAHSDFAGRIPMGRLVEPEELVGACVYLASEASRMVTGQTLLVDGGWSAL